MKFDLQNKDGLTLKTKGKYVREDIAVGLSESDKSALVPENMVEEASVLGVQGSLKKYDGTFEGEAQAEVNELKKLLDVTQSSSYFFVNCSLTDVSDYIKLLDTSNVTDMNNMFSYCTALTTVPLLDTSNVTAINMMFSYCTALTTVPLLDTSNVTNISAMFSGCTALTSIPLLDTSNVTQTVNLFNGCTALTSIPLLDTSKVTDMKNMFNNCTALETLPRLDTSNVTNMSYMFKGCYKLKTIDITRFYSTSTNSTQMCSNCYSLKALIIRLFGQYRALNSNSFSNCYHLTGTVNETYNPNGDKDCYIYVPKNMIETLSSATNWSTYASQLRALEDYTVDGTTTGELDESKVNA